MQGAGCVGKDLTANALLSLLHYDATPTRDFLKPCLAFFVPAVRARTPRIGDNGKILDPNSRSRRAAS
jgi:hypothetical protein